MLLSLVVYAVGVSESYMGITQHKHKKLLDSEETNKAFFLLRRYRSGDEYVAMVTIMMCSSWCTSTLQNFNPGDLRYKS